MKEFEKKLRLRMYLGFSFTTFMIIANIIVLNSVYKSIYSGFVMGMFSGIAAIGFILALRARFALRDQEKKRALYVEENDERAIRIGEKSSKFTVIFILLGNLIAGAIVLFFYPVIGFTMIGISVETAILSLASTFYYGKKL